MRRLRERPGEWTVLATGHRSNGATTNVRRGILHVHPELDVRVESRRSPDGTYVVWGMLRVPKESDE